jgi:phage recombination protein Bet
MLCKARALNPFEGDAFLIGYDCKDGAKFNLITAHQAFLKRAEVNPDFDGMESGIVVKDESGKTVEKQGDYREQGENLVGGWARVHFKNKSIPMFKKINLERFRKPFGVWNEMPEGMIVKCAEADALRSAFPTKMGGLYLKEEVERIEDGKATGRTVMEDNAVEVMPLDGEPDSKAEQLASKLKDKKKECKADDTSPEPAAPPAFDRENAITELMALVGTSKAGKIDKAMKEVGLKYTDGTDWDTNPLAFDNCTDKAIATLISLLKC